eukprot:1749988-Pleurochrysis_carterae.AAC.7
MTLHIDRHKSLYLLAVVTTSPMIQGHNSLGTARMELTLQEEAATTQLARAEAQLIVNLPHVACLHANKCARVFVLAHASS